MNEQRGTQKQIAKRYKDRVESYNAKSRSRRIRFWLSFIAIAGWIAAIYFAQDRTPSQFFNTGPLSRNHSALQDDCASCHKPESLAGGLSSSGHFFQILNERFENGAPSFKRIEQACETCHQQHTFHEPNVIGNRSCTACHKEHQGPGPMHRSVSLDCASCHDNRDIMQASAQAGKQLPPAQFHLNPKVVNASNPRTNILRLPRPVEGYTMAFASFSDGHPPFQLQRENVRDADVLRFNHQRHLDGPGMPLTKAGTKLDCNYCHKPEPSGRYMQRISFEANCQECHSLQFDVKNPDFHLPHGDAQLVRTFLRTLPAQYAEFARQRGLTNQSRINEFATQQVRQLLTQFPTGEELERNVFFTKDPYKGAQPTDPATRAKYTGCAFCHEVKQAPGTSYPTAEITAPVFIDRWMPHAHFNHAKHEGVANCRECHVAAASSQLTTDVLMPTKESCVRCHSPTGLARNASECATCHTYHSPEPTVTTSVTASNISFKQMLLGSGR